MLICLNDTFLCQYPNLIESLLGVSSLDAMRVISRPWLQNSWCWGSDMWDGRCDQTSGLGAEGRKIWNPVLSCTWALELTVFCIPCYLFLLPTPFLMVLTPVSRDVLRGCKCYLSGGWCLISLIAETPSKLLCNVPEVWWLCSQAATGKQLLCFVFVAVRV